MTKQEIKKNTKRLQATRKIGELSSLGMTNESIIDLFNGLMSNKINNDNMSLCLEIKRQLKIN